MCTPLRVLLLIGLLACACRGPAASDPELCQDLVHRLCLAASCSQVAPLYGGTDCQSALLSHTGCDSQTFTFSSPSRARVLSCRKPLLQEGDDTEAVPSCADVSQALSDCPDLLRFLQAGAP